MRSASVRGRLTITYALATLALLLGSLLAMRGFAHGALQRAHEDAAQRSAALVRSFFRAELGEYRVMDVTLSHLAGELVFAGMTIEFLRPDGKTFATARQPLQDGRPRPPVVVRTEPLDRELAPGWNLRLTISTADLTAARARIDRFTRFAVPVAALLAALVAWFMTGRALSPAREMARAAARLKATDGGRLPIADSDDEFGRLGQAFNDLLGRLERALEHERRFLANAAHELRTPVARLLARTEAQRSTTSTDGDRATLAAVEDELRHTATVIDELLHLARADAGAMQIQRQDCFLDDVAADAMARLEPAARARSIVLDLGGLGEAPVVGDPHLLGQLVSVLVDNAIRYTPAGGRISIATTREGAFTVLRVDDSGPGIPRDEREEVFSRFGRGRIARQLRPEGTGLGLAIARSVAAAHGGTVIATDSPLGGARLEVTLPSG